ncbi:5-(carboxyamino)imidazole ribonucleotide synthase [Hyphomicrobium sp. D-2]|uniref:5-(carboxyamino)imidazole ribonucleotide synthase n=1 Tax=Hyphomicrobium sp. D-2 TaxID=3041621 RepID=UPI002458348C|nr:5-(carboxyamino)imidazole ribonucleotide synthase [Hyphomicrobium sp. D-2]MDH4982363.1 5-(carboxyamino)imidazole ribonucleotide synthase [Hyphomicrobium sp. D-2]
MQPLPPGSTIGILGAGQLGRMLAVAASRLGLKAHIYSDVPGPASDVAASTTIGAYDDLAKITAFAAETDVITYEFENVPVSAAAAVEKVRPVRPGLKPLEVAQDRFKEKSFIASLGLPLPRFALVEGPGDFAAAIEAVGAPSILKSRRLGYDGKGQARLASPDQIGEAFEAIGRAPATLEAMVNFQFEVSVLLVRGINGETLVYDIPQNHHEGGILRTSTVPSRLPAAHRERAIEIASTLAEALGYVGLIGVEMFYVGDALEPLLLNEFAPRVHNSGHWTMDACAVGQFENHIRAVAGWPLGATERHSDCQMTNLIGDDVAAWPQLAGEANACLHLYGKNKALPGRKMGHVNRLFPRSGDVETRSL